ncbi:MAG: DUF1847 domain-containing protein, partial [Bacteroidetes bacterium]|nr:DUF1847 domain-containing protein [Bacteroidota bacterium]
MKCAVCENKECVNGKDCTRIKEQIINFYSGADLELLRISASVESDFYMKGTRLDELINFALRMNYTRLGIAFCTGLENEAKYIHRILEKTGFHVFSVVCKVCGIDKSLLKLNKLKRKGFQATCNPAGQAMILNENKTDLNIIIGL